MQPKTLSLAQLRHALNLRDLTDPEDGSHAMQQIVERILDDLRLAWGCALHVHRGSPIVSVQDNYDRLRYPPDGAARDARYTRYVTDNAVLRTSTSAMVPIAMRTLGSDQGEMLLACPGLVYRRDSIDRLHLGEPHQIDLWRLSRRQDLDTEDLRAMVCHVVRSALPGMEWRVEPRVHPYTKDGLQIDVLHEGTWIEIGECGRAHPAIITDNLARPDGVTGLAMGLGLDRIVMIRKGMSDIRLLRSAHPRIAAQMQDLKPYRAVSSMPPVIRDLSIVCDHVFNAEDIGDRVRDALGADADVVESVEILSISTCDQLPESAIRRLQLRPYQVNLVLRVVLRALDRTLTHEACNRYRDRIYAALYQGTVQEWALPCPTNLPAGMPEAVEKSGHERSCPD